MVLTDQPGVVDEHVDLAKLADRLLEEARGPIAEPPVWTMQETLVKNVLSSRREPDVAALLGETGVSGEF